MMTLVDVEHLLAIGAAIATIYAACVAAKSLNAWRGQLEGTAEYRLARRALIKLLRLRDRIRSARQPLNHLVGATQDEMRQPNADLVNRQREEYWGWMKEVAEAALEVRDLRPECEIEWGDRQLGILDSLDQRARSLRGGFETYYQFRLSAISGAKGLDDAIAKAHLTIFAQQPVESDEFETELGKAVEGAMALLLPILGKKSGRKADPLDAIARR